MPPTREQRTTVSCTEGRRPAGGELGTNDRLTELI